LEVDIFLSSPFLLLCCHVQDGQATGNVLLTLAKSGRDALAFQLAFDLFDSATQQFLGVVSAQIKAAAAAGAAPAAAAEGEAAAPAAEGEALSAEVKEILTKVQTILSGDLTLALTVEFLSRNNHADKLLMTNVKDAAGRNSITNNATVMANAMMYAGTTSDVFLVENKEWLKSASNWALFNAGLLHTHTHTHTTHTHTHTHTRTRTHSQTHTHTNSHAHARSHSPLDALPLQLRHSESFTEGTRPRLATCSTLTCPRMEAPVGTVRTLTVVVCKLQPCDSFLLSVSRSGRR
jgi:hypothetical protein